MLDIQVEKKNTTIKTADLTYEGNGRKSSDLCGILGFVDDQGRIHLTSNFDLFEMKPKLTDFHPTTSISNGGEETKLSVKEFRSIYFRIFIKIFRFGFSQRADLDEKFGTEKKRRSVHSKKRNTIEIGALQTAVSSAREQVLNTTQDQLNDTSINHDISTIDVHDEQAAIPRPNYAAEKVEDAFNLDESSFVFRNCFNSTNFVRFQLSMPMICCC